MDVKTILAAGLNFNFDNERIKQEILSTRSHWGVSPPWLSNINRALSGQVFMSESAENYEKIDRLVKDTTVIRRDLKGQYIFYMRSHGDNPDQITRFDYTKQLQTEGWRWREELKPLLPYTIECIESLPYNSIGCIRVFITENTFFATHRDYGWGTEALSKDYDRCFGLSIIPDTGGVPMKIQSFETGTVHEIPGNAMLFNDSAWHGVGMVEKTRITIRVFGDIDYQSFLPYIDPNSLVVA